MSKTKISRAVKKSKNSETPTILVVVEGQTEENYFNSLAETLKKKISNLKIKISDIGGKVDHFLDSEDRNGLIDQESATLNIIACIGVFDLDVKRNGEELKKCLSIREDGVITTIFLTYMKIGCSVTFLRKR